MSTRSVEIEAGDLLGERRWPLVQRLRESWLASNKREHRLIDRGQEWAIKQASYPELCSLEDLNRRVKSAASEHGMDRALRQFLNVKTSGDLVDAFLQFLGYSGPGAGVARLTLFGTDHPRIDANDLGFWMLGASMVWSEVKDEVTGSASRVTPDDLKDTGKH